MRVVSLSHTPCTDEGEPRPVSRRVQIGATTVTLLLLLAACSTDGATMGAVNSGTGGASDAASAPAETSAAPTSASSTSPSGDESASTTLVEFPGSSTSEPATAPPQASEPSDGVCVARQDPATGDVSLVDVASGGPCPPEVIAQRPHLDAFVTGTTSPIGGGLYAADLPVPLPPGSLNEYWTCLDETEIGLATLCFEQTEDSAIEPYCADLAAAGFTVDQLIADALEQGTIGDDEFLSLQCQGGRDGRYVVVLPNTGLAPAAVQVWDQAAMQAALSDLMSGAG